MDRQTVFTIGLCLGVFGLLLEIMGMGTGSWVRIYDHGEHRMSEVGLWNIPECLDTNTTDCGAARFMYDDSGYLRLSPYLALFGCVLTLCGLGFACVVYRKEVTPTYDKPSRIGPKLAITSAPLYLASTVVLVVVIIHLERVRGVKQHIAALDNTEMLLAWSLLLYGIGGLLGTLSGVFLSVTSCMTSNKLRRNGDWEELVEEDMCENEGNE